MIRGAGSKFNGVASLGWFTIGFSARAIRYFLEKSCLQLGQKHFCLIHSIRQAEWNRCPHNETTRICPVLLGSRQIMQLSFSASTGFDSPCTSEDITIGKYLFMSSSVSWTFISGIIWVLVGTKLVLGLAPTGGLLRSWWINSYFCSKRSKDKHW